MAELSVAEGFTLPLEAVTETFAILAKRRVGKSNAAVVMAEQMYDAGLPWVAVDPKGDWWGVRSSGDGNGPGLAIPVFGGERAILTVLAQYPHGRTRTQLTTLAGYTYSGGFRNALAALRTAGYLLGGNNDVMAATDAGREALGDWEPLPTGDELLAYWLSEKNLGKAERLILRELVDRYPDHVPGPQLAEMCGYEFSGGFRNALAKLRTLELIVGSNTTGVAAHHDFMEAIGG